jgi:cell wall-associated NlpC family hydrolase
VGTPVRASAAALGGLGAMVLFVVIVAAAAPTALLGDVEPSQQALSSIPPAYLSLYIQAAGQCLGLPWTVLAAIGTVESDNGTSSAPGVRSGANPAGAEGPMQFEPRTFAQYDRPVPPGGADPPSPYDATDAVFAAARMLCANGARNGVDLYAAVFAYNHSPSYVSEVLALAPRLGQPPGSTASATAAGWVSQIAVDWSLTQVGTPYIWGGETPGVGFDCSGLVQAAYAAAGVALPRVAQDQFDVGPHLPDGYPLQPGDLVFFGGGPGDVQHVGLYVGSDGGQDFMVDAPHTGADVRIEPFPTTIGAPFGDEHFLGATRPAG